MSDNLRHKAVHGTMWGALERFSVQGIQFVVMIFMARILTPADYGLIGMLVVYISVAQSLVDSGFSQAIIRKRDRTQTDNSTAFYFNIAVGVALYLLLYVTAPLIARFYNQPQLTAITRVLCIGIILNSVVVVQRALLTEKVDFKTQAKASTAAALTSGAVGLTMAYNGMGVWSLVGQQLTNLGVDAMLLWVFAGWRPSWRYSWASFRSMFSFGFKLAVSGIINTLYDNLYLIVIGKIFKATELGYYTRSYQFASFPSQSVTGVLQRVTFPILCAVQNDSVRLRDIYRRVLRVSAFIVFPLMTGLAAVATPLIVTILKEQWASAGVLLSIICFALMWYPIHAINLNLLLAKGRSDIFLKLEIVKKLIGVAILAITMPFGVTVMCYGLVANSVLCLLVNTAYTGRLIGMGFLAQMRDLLPVLIYSLSMFALVRGIVLMIADPLWATVAGVITGAVYYPCVALLTGSHDLKETIGLLKRKGYDRETG